MVIVGCKENLLAEEHPQAHFQQYGNVEYAAIHKPWRSYVMGTFTDAQVAKRLCGKRHTLQGKELLSKPGKIREEHKQYENR